MIEYKAFENGIWNVAVTMTTLGYGDYYPVTHLGRFICCMTIFCGQFLESLTIGTLYSVASLSNDQKKVYY